YLTLDSSVTPADARKIRGYFGSLFRHKSVVHHHQPDGSLRYRYPVIQYKVIHDNIIIIGFLEGLEVIREIFEELQVVIIDGRWQEILTKALYSYEAEFGLTEQLRGYTFLTPWLALNEENYETYQKYGSRQKRRELLARILIGNILSVAKGIGYTVPGPLRAEIDDIRETRTTLKGTPMLGFTGTFRVNFEIPRYWGLGKSVSRGFGTVAPL
ncbi:MAG: CRISPR-associated endonuclease Cas6, partial [candidate division WOR-3 bacterium]